MEVTDVTLLLYMMSSIIQCNIGSERKDHGGLKLIIRKQLKQVPGLPVKRCADVRWSR